jgi:hypothetical protein
MARLGIEPRDKCRVACSPNHGKLLVVHAVDLLSFLEGFNVSGIRWNDFGRWCGDIREIWYEGL